MPGTRMMTSRARPGLPPANLDGRRHKDVGRASLTEGRVARSTKPLRGEELSGPRQKSVTL